MVMQASRKRRWTLVPEPYYPQNADRGDFLISDQERGSTWIELAHVHDCTMDKWLAKIERDRLKLRAAPHPALQVIGCFSYKSIERESWKRWLARCFSWNQRTNLELNAPLFEEGQMIVRGWAY